MTLCGPATGAVRVRGTRSGTHAVLPHWRPADRVRPLAALPGGEAPRSPAETRQPWESGQEGRTTRITLPSALPRLRRLWVLDNLTGQRPPSLGRWLCAQGIRPLYTPLGGSWLHRGEALQRSLKRRG
jgi:hypothetical protein